MEQLGYVTEVLNRAGVDNLDMLVLNEFRDKIMKEYRYELLGEGEDA